MCATALANGDRDATWALLLLSFFLCASHRSSARMVLQPHGLWSLQGAEINAHHVDDGEMKNDLDFLTNVTRTDNFRVLGFGQGSVGHGRDSRYWDRDDRRREGDYNEDDVTHDGKEARGGSAEKDHDPVEVKVGKEKTSQDDPFKGLEQRGVGLYNEDGRNELKRESSSLHDAETKDQSIAKDSQEVSDNMLEKSLNSRTMDNIHSNSRQVRATGSQSTSKSQTDSKEKGAGNFLYVEMEERPNVDEQWEPRFAGHQSLQEREESFLVHDQKINCGFVKGPEGSPSTGFDLAEDDANYVSRCHIAVISCIFGNSDRLRSPTSKMVTRLSRKNVCFVMFVDEVTLQTLSSEGQIPDRAGFIGLWKIVVVKNQPYTDMRRVGKIPKLLPHRLFPSARYSIWLDSKLRFQLDPLLVLEYFLGRKGHEYAISNHYDRHCVWEEVAQNKRLNKYNHTVIDQQFTFYQADGLKRFNASDPNKLLPSNVPEGSLIVRAHTPMSNLFSCLWFNEDCERRAIAKLFRHRSDERRNNSHKHQESTE
ncbi:hypothetical protein GH714_017851 [Hevea brasiliensis]|uniref:TOD1/MUCI70 glycosyltransferase-like domain-containing protein n=1 Tax=Hevea brasiliensis TaxID=3981 RepID=A0A6A6KRX7_HEVBR|nr:hypothetical protein GH714_017851 [Hevea brasiliensis]